MEVLLKKAQKGDKHAFDKIIEKIQRKLYVIAKSRISNEEDIEDILQETVMYAYININKLRELDKFNSWIIKILINNCNKMYVRNHIKTLSYDEVHADNMNLNEESQIKNVEAEISFYNIIDFLDMDDRTIITLYYLKDYTTKQISEILNINESTLRSRISIIRKKIKDRYGKEMQ